jgi:hypothetical protein
MVIMAVRKHQRVDRGRIDMEEPHIVVEGARRIAKIDQSIAFLAAFAGRGVKRESEFAGYRRPGRPVADVEAEALDRKIAELRVLADGDLIAVDQHGDCQFIDFRNLSGNGFRP